MSQLYLSRLSLRRDASLAALAPLLVPADSGAQTGIAHRLIWAAFADDPKRERDFLWRQDEKKTLARALGETAAGFTRAFRGREQVFRSSPGKRASPHLRVARQCGGDAQG